MAWMIMVVGTVVPRVIVVMGITVFGVIMFMGVFVGMAVAMGVPVFMGVHIVAMAMWVGMFVLVWVGMLVVMFVLALHDKPSFVEWIYFAKRIHLTIESPCGTVKGRAFEDKAGAAVQLW